MASSTIKIRVVVKNGVTIVKALISHPMETGHSIDRTTGKKIPAHFIQHLKCEINNKVILRAQWSAAISRNPYLSFKYNGGKTGDLLKIFWEDNTGQSDTAEAQLN